MRDSLKLTTPLIPHESISGKYKSPSEVIIEGTQPDKVNKPNKESTVDDKKSDSRFLNENLGKKFLSPVLNNSNDIADNLKKIFSLLEHGIRTTSDSVRRDPIRALFDSLYLSTDEMVNSMVSQEKSVNLYKGPVFDTFREFLDKFKGNERIKNTIVEIMKIYDCSVNRDNSLRSVMNNCNSILQYLLPSDRKQFAQYLGELKSMLLPYDEINSNDINAHENNKGDKTNPNPDSSNDTVKSGSIEQSQQTSSAKANSAGNNEASAVSRYAKKSTLSQAETAKLLKSSLIPLLGEIVAKYHQEENIRNTVMTIVHNLVRYDKSDTSLLKQAVSDLTAELRMVANIPEFFESEILKQLSDYAVNAQNNNDKTLSTITKIISRAIDDNSNVGIARQAENILISMLYNESPVMNLLHYILPLKIGNDRAFAEMYVDPDNNERKSDNSSNSRKIFLSIASDYHGNFELCFWVYNKKIDFTLWCPESLLNTLKIQKEAFERIMKSKGYALGVFNISEYSKPQSVAQIFPRLITKKIGVNIKV